MLRSSSERETTVGFGEKVLFFGSQLIPRLTRAANVTLRRAAKWRSHLGWHSQRSERHSDLALDSESLMTLVEPVVLRGW